MASHAVTKYQCMVRRLLSVIFHNFTGESKLLSVHISVRHGEVVINGITAYDSFD